MKKVLALLLAFTLVFTLAGCKDKVNQEDVDNVADATQKLSLDVSDVLAVTATFELQAAGLHDTVITWESSNAAVVSTAGVVNRPAIGAGDATVILTATITLNDEVLTKEFTVKVLEAVPTSAVTIAVLNSAAVAVDDTVQITGVVVGTIIGKGFHIYDGTGFSYVYQGTEPIFALGDKVTVTGTKVIYFNLIEVSNVTSAVLVDSGNALPAFTPMTIADISLEDNTNTDIYNTQVEITGVVELVGAYNNVYITWVDADFNQVTAEVYYKSGSPDKISELVALDGKLVTVEAILMDFHTTEGWRISVNTNSTITEETMTDLQKAQYAAGMLSLGDTTVVDGDLELPLAGGLTSTITWASDNEAVVAVDGKVTGAVVESDVVLTATVTVGTASVDKTFDLHVLDAASIPLSVTAALALADDTEVAVVGVVTGFNYSEPMIQDADGTAIYINSDIEAMIGDKVVITGTLATYESWGTVQRRLDDAALVKVVSSENDLFVFDTYMVDDIFTDYPANSSQRITLTDVIVGIDDGYGYTFVVSGEANFKFKAPAYFYSIFAEGDTIAQITFNVLELNYDNVKVVQVVFGGLTEAEYMLAATMTVSAPDAAVEDIMLVTELPDFGATIVWASDTEAVISAMGVVDRPANGAGDATVVLTATITVGATVETLDFTVVVAEESIPVPDLFFSEYIEGSGNNKALEIFNPTNATIDLTLYSVSENYGSGENVYDLTGTLAPGEVFVICNDTEDNDAALLAACDVSLAYPSVAHFNGNDTVALLKDGKVIDQFGAPSDAGATDFAKDVTMVRNADVAWGNELYTIEEWTVLATDTFTDIGMHTSDFPAAAVPELFISEYYEGSVGNNKAIEIYNPTGAEVDLTLYTLYGEGGSSGPQTYDLTGTLAAGEVLLICADGIDNAVLVAECDVLLPYPSTVHFNGNDIVALQKDGVIIDIIGVLADAGGDDFAKDIVLVRNPDIVMGNVTFNLSEWTEFAADTTDDIGSHTVN